MTKLTGKTPNSGKHAICAIVLLWQIAWVAPVLSWEQTDVDRLVAAALQRAGGNSTELQAALDTVPESQRQGLDFLVAHMPAHDLQELSADFLLEHVALAYRAMDEAPWKESVSQEIFLNCVLPYAVVSEQRDQWRRDFYERFKPMVENIDSSGRAGAALNQQLFAKFNVRYSTDRPRTDMSPLETLELGRATCTGLSILLIDACRAVGIPARFAGTPLWPDGSGNHSWVEIWDHGWHFTGAAEATGDELDQGWFVDKAAGCPGDNPRHAIYATSFRRTPLRFPLSWNPSADYVYAVNVTDRYAGKSEPLAEGNVRVYFRVHDPATGKRRAVPIRVRDSQQNVVFEATTKDERFDTNDHVAGVLLLGGQYTIGLNGDEANVQAFRAEKADQLVSVEHDGDSPLNPVESAAAVKSLEDQLRQHKDDRKVVDQWLQDQDFRSVPLTREDAVRAAKLLCEEHARYIRATRTEEVNRRTISLDGVTMLFDFKVFGEKPPQGRSLYISMHGGGETTKEVNDQQWHKHQDLYQPQEGIYLCPRAPTDTWNLWHHAHVDRLFDRLIENLIVLEDVDPNRVYLMGYSAGGDGVYQLAPRMADRWAAAAMMAGHPNNASLLSLRNVAFTLHMGGKDDAYGRNEAATGWATRLEQLREDDPQGYLHWVEIYPDKGHWMDLEDAAAIPWMADRYRDPWPKSLVWEQHSVYHSRHHWLAIRQANHRPGAVVRALRDGQRVDLESSAEAEIVLRFNDQMLDLDEPVTIYVRGQQVHNDIIPRTIEVLASTLAERGDPSSLFGGELSVSIPVEQE